MTPPDLLVQIAEEQMGLREEPKGSNSGPALKKFFEADDLEIDNKTDGYPWCASFVSWCLQEWVRRLQRSGKVIENFAAPCAARAFALESWAARNGCIIKPPSIFNPQRGDIVTYKFSHCGIITAVSKNDPRFFSAIEGNTNDDGSAEGYEVSSRARSALSLRFIIRPPAPICIDAQKK